MLLVWMFGKLLWISNQAVKKAVTGDPSSGHQCRQEKEKERLDRKEQEAEINDDVVADRPRPVSGSLSPFS